MITTRKMGSGLAFTPEKDLALFAEMAKKGKRLSGSTAIGQWRFEDAEPEDKVFELLYEADLDDDYAEMIRQSGWEQVYHVAGLHIFKADPGTISLHTNPESKRAELTRQQRWSLKLALVFLVVLAAMAWIVTLVQLPDWVEVLMIWVPMVPFIYTFFPFVGYSWKLWRM